MAILKCPGEEFETFGVISDPAWIIFGLPDAFELHFELFIVTAAANTSRGPHDFDDEVEIFSQNAVDEMDARFSGLKPDAAFFSI